MRLMTIAEGPARLSRLRSAQAVGRDTPRAMACLPAESNPSATNASRISASFDTCLRFALSRDLIADFQSVSPSWSPRTFMRARNGLT